MRMKFLWILQKHGGSIMSSIRNITSSTTVPDDLAKRLGPNGVNEILLTLWQGYHDLIADPAIKITKTANEDDITQEWYGKISQRWAAGNRAVILKLHNIGPVHQYQDPAQKKSGGYRPTIDFCFRDWDTSNSYFGSECKNLYDNRNDKIKRYVSTGVNNYTSGRYGSQSSESSLIGYVLSGNIPKIVTELSAEIAKTLPISNLSRELRYIDPQYSSHHQRNIDNSEIIIHHLFFDFT